MRKAAGLLAGILLIVAIMCVPAPVWALEAKQGEPPDPSKSPSPSSEITAAPPDWLEPRGLSVVDLVGWVPESDLAGAIIQYTPGYGILRYKSGSRVGDTVTITATAYPRFYTDPFWNGSLFGCLGQAARIDELGAVAPATTLRVYAPNDQDITRQVDGFYYVPAGLTKPIRNPHESEVSNQYRYWETNLQPVSFTTDGALLLPANMGCRLLISFKDYRELTLVFKAEVAPVVSVQVLGRQTFQFPVYTGSGFAGHIEALHNQLAAACTVKPPKIATMTIPLGTDYFLFNYPPILVDPYTAFPYNPLGNVDRPAGISYRLRTPRGLSVDHVISPGLPLYAHWVDMDQALGTQYLPYTSQIVGFEGLEPFLPAAIGYDPCMVSGNCSAAKLAQICNTPMSARMIYLRVDRIQAGLSRIPLQMPGPAWRPASAASTGTNLEAALGVTPPKFSGVSAAPAVTKPYRIYLPSVERSQRSVEPDDPIGCSTNGGCGWFTSDGRMVDYIALP